MANVADLKKIYRANCSQRCFISFYTFVPMLRIGKIVATHGLQGTLVLTHMMKENNWLKKDQVLFVALKRESYIPYFVTNVKGARAQEYQIQLEDIDHIDKARALVGKEVYVDAEVLGQATKDNPLLWIGFSIVDTELGNVGLLRDVAQTGHQWIGTLIYNDKEVLIPLVDDLIRDINLRNRFIRMELPPGILDL